MSSISCFFVKKWRQSSRSVQIFKKAAVMGVMGVMGPRSRQNRKSSRGLRGLRRWAAGHEETAEANGKLCGPSA